MLLLFMKMKLTIRYHEYIKEHSYQVIQIYP